jgi:hypothetical protein
VSTLAIELNDAAISTIREDDPPGSVARSSPGYAVVDGTTIFTGEEAMKQARLKPRRTHHRFWSQLDTRPLGRPFPGRLSTADLVHAHLSEIWERTRPGIDRVVLALPGSHSEHQMGMIVGIAQACGMPVAALVDSAVAAATTTPVRGHVLHLDLELNGAVVSELTANHEVVRRRVQVAEHTGLVKLRDTWAKRVAKAFVTRTRFDPLHDAASEQALHQNLIELLPRLRDHRRIVIGIETGGGIQSVEIDRDELVESVAEDYDGLRQMLRQLKRVGRPATVLLSDRVATLPGFEEGLTELDGTDVVRLAAAAAAAGALGAAGSMRPADKEVPHVIRLELPRDDRAAEKVAPPPPTVPNRKPPPERPSHVLYEGRAWSISREPFVIGVAPPDGARGLKLDGSVTGVSRIHCTVRARGDRVVVEDHSTHGSFLNGQRVEGSASVVRGDRLRVGSPGTEFQFITVVPDDATPRD